MNSYPRIRSFVGRNSRMTSSQRQAYQVLAPTLLSQKQLLNFLTIFPYQQAIYLEIGFGFGHSLIAAAQAFPQFNFLGVETHQPGIAATLQAINNLALKNLQIIQGDVIDVVTKAIPDQSLSGVNIFFPDPWPKRRHQQRRLIQKNFLEQLVQKCLPNATLHMATDWEDYAQHILQVASQIGCLKILGSPFAPRSCFRPLNTKFEQRALRAERSIWDFQWQISNK